MGCRMLQSHTHYVGHLPHDKNMKTQEIMNYQETLDYLYQFVHQSHQTASPGRNLERTTALLELLGRPEQAVPTLVVAGTKGKGSTCAMVEAICRAAGLRVGLWTSPHLHSYRERIQVNRVLISEQELIRCVSTIQPLVEQLGHTAIGTPSTFAIGFCLAMRYFADQHVDLAIIEVGLGGRYDSAAVLTPLVSVITSISYDHMDILGDTLTHIASDKAGILKTAVPGITTRQEPEAIQAITRVASTIGTPLYVVNLRANDILPTAAIRFEPCADYAERPQPALAGSFQQENACLAIGTVQLLSQRGLDISAAAIESGLKMVHWPARFEEIPGQPNIVIDGAHNGDSTMRLLEALDERYPGQPITLVFGTSRNKDLERMLAAFAPRIQHWVITRSTHPRAMGDLSGLRQQILDSIRTAQGPESTLVLVEPEPDQALALACDLAAKQAIPAVVCVTGSLFVAAAAREALGLAKERDP